MWVISVMTGNSPWHQGEEDEINDNATDWNLNTMKNNKLRAFIGVEAAALTFRTQQHSTSYSSQICYGKRFYNDFFLNHHTIALVHNCLKLLNCVVNETPLDGMKRINCPNSLLSTSKRTI